MLKEFRRDSFAFAMRTASVLADFCFGFAPLWELPIAGFIGVGIVEVLPTGWVFIGPVIDLLLGIVDNSAGPGWSKRKTTAVNRQRRGLRSILSDAKRAPGPLVGTLESRHSKNDVFSVG
jgi:hypothetical protein